MCGGGRYDGLFEQLGGKPTPAVGWGMGIERMMLLLEAVGVAMPACAPHAYAIVPGADAVTDALVTCEALRAAGVQVLMQGAGSEGWPGLKAQFRRADQSGARWALVFGADERARGMVAVKALREPGAPQVERPLVEAARWAAQLLA